MIQKGTKFVVADNTGAKIVECITVLGHSKYSHGEIGNIITASVKIASPRCIVKKKDVVKAVVVRTKKEIGREDGSYIRFDDNAVVIINEDGIPRGTRIFGPIPREIREKYMKIISLASDVV